MRLKSRLAPILSMSVLDTSATFTSSITCWASAMLSRLTTLAPAALAAAAPPPPPPLLTASRVPGSAGLSPAATGSTRLLFTSRTKAAAISSAALALTALDTTPVRITESAAGRTWMPFSFGSNSRSLASMRLWSMFTLTSMAVGPALLRQMIRLVEP
ncbi:hypothetical protein D9M68_852530 [compost metagenome]